MTPTLGDAFAGLADGIGLSRPACLCFAAIWTAPSPPTADDLVAAAGISRSNVSTALKELRAWGLVSIVRRQGDRKEYFAAPADPWEVVRLVAAGRQRRVLEPLLERLLLAETDSADARVAALHDAVTRLDRWLTAVANLGPQDLRSYVSDAPVGKTKKKKKKKRGKDDGTPAPEQA